MVGLALGAGVARGWGHIGVLRELEACGVRPKIVAGASIGAVVGGCYAAGELDSLEAFARSMTRRGILNWLDISLNGGGLFGGAKLRSKLDASLPDLRIETLPTRFAAIATEVGSGHEIWLTHGPLATAIQASYAMPGIFEPVRIGGRWLFDGALVNPVPVSACRVMGAEIVIAVTLVPNPQFRVPTPLDDDPQPGPPDTGVADKPAAGRGFLSEMLSRGAAKRIDKASTQAPGIARVMSDAFNITQDRIARSRLAGDPPDVMIRVRTGDIGLFDFHRADELIAQGRRAVQRALPDIEELMQQAAQGAHQPL